MNSNWPRTKFNKGKYPWHLWLDGNIWQLQRDIDFDCPVRTFCRVAHTAAHKRGLTLRTSMRERDKGIAHIQVITDSNEDMPQGAVVKEFPPTRDRPTNKYPWDKWLNGQIWKLTQGTEFQSTITSMRAAAYARAHVKNIRIRIMSDAPHVYIQALEDNT